MTYSGTPADGNDASEIAEATDTLRKARTPLVRRDVVIATHRALTLAGDHQAADAFLEDVERHASYLERCAEQADAVLRGDLAASNRLWLLLRESIGASPRAPASILGDGALEAQLAMPQTIDPEALVRLVAGVTRAANRPSEADTMLESLGHLLQPLFTMDVAAAAAERARAGDRSLYETVVTARMAPVWRAGVQPVDPVRPTDPVLPVPGQRLDADRVTLDLASWQEDHTSPVLRWGPVWGCVGGTHKAMSQIDRFGTRYHIDSISNPGACAGETVTIRGRDFGPMGRVSFPSPSIKDPAFALGAGDDGVLAGVSAARWTDTEIDVVVPVWATAGALHLNAFVRHRDPCATIDVYRLGNSVLFVGGLASVYEVSLGGVPVDLAATAPRNLTPGDAVALTWRSSGGPTTRISIQLMDGATQLWSRSNLPGGFGGVVLSVPDPAPQQPRSVRLVFTATSACGATQPLSLPMWLSVPPHLSIQYIEVTQGVQADLAGVLAGQAMPTVAYKDTAVRVHMACDRKGWFNNQLDKITGTLLLDGRRLAPTNVRVMLPPDRGFAAIRGLSNADLTNDTLNFTIPAAWLTPGAHTLSVTLICNDPSGRIVVGQQISWTWVAKSPLRVRGVYMALYGSDAFILDYVRAALDYLPTPLTDIGIAAPRWMPHTYDMSASDGWEDLLDDLEDAWDDADEASGVRWLGIVSAGERYLGQSLAQQGRSGVPSIAVLAMGDRPDVGAHELGHSYGLNHVDLPAGSAKGPFDAADSGGRLRRAPFDVRTSTAIPLPAGDLMSYFEPIRAGISTWMRLFLNA